MVWGCPRSYHESPFLGLVLFYVGDCRCRVLHHPYCFLSLSCAYPPFSFPSLFPLSSSSYVCPPPTTILSFQKAKEVADLWPPDCGKSKTFCKWEWPETDFRSFRTIAKKTPGLEVTESVGPGRSLGYEWFHLIESTVRGPPFLSHTLCYVAQVKGLAQHQQMYVERPANWQLLRRGAFRCLFSASLMGPDARLKFPIFIIERGVLLKLSLRK